MNLSFNLIKPEDFSASVTERLHSLPYSIDNKRVSLIISPDIFSSCIDAIGRGEDFSRAQHLLFPVFDIEALKKIGQKFLKIVNRQRNVYH